MDCKSMDITMVTNLNMLSGSSSYLVDPMMYKQMIRSSMYMFNTILDIWFVVNTLIQYIINPKHVHLITLKHVLRYLKGTIGYGLRYVSGSEVKLQGYADFDWVGGAMDRKSTSWTSV